MKNEIKEINIKIPGQILDYVDTKEHLLELFNHITNLQEENEKVHKDFDELSERYFFTKSRNEKAIEKIDKVEEHCTTPIFNTRGFLNDIKNILNGGDDNE